MEARQQPGRVLLPALAALLAALALDHRIAAQLNVIMHP
jgi:hypothetical protein